MMAPCPSSPHFPLLLPPPLLSLLVSNQVSWLGAWALLLGCRDHKTEADMASGRPHLRPSEADMLPVFEQWARIAAAAEVRGG